MNQTKHCTWVQQYKAEEIKNDNRLKCIAIYLIIKLKQMHLDAKFWFMSTYLEQ